MTAAEDRVVTVPNALSVLRLLLIPVFFWLVLVARELLLLALVPALRRRGLVALPVHYLGKAATFALYWGFPFVLVGDGSAEWEQVLGALGWAFVIWGTALYWYAALLYIEQARRVLAVGTRAD